MPFEHFNYQHLYYFWIVAREGGIARASEFLDISPSTISAQVSQLEEALQVNLFRRQGRNIRLTEVGQVAFRYAEEIFLLGREMTHALRGWHTSGPVFFRVGIADAVPKMVATKLLEPAVSAVESMHLICREGASSTLLSELALYHFDLLLLDSAVDSSSPVKASNHLLVVWDVAFFGTPELVGRLQQDWPRALEGAPVLLPTAGSAIRTGIDRWLEESGIQPRVAGEFDDSALMKAFSETGTGLFPAPLGIAAELKRQHGVEPAGMAEGCQVSFYAVTVRRKFDHPAVKAVLAAGIGKSRVP